MDGWTDGTLELCPIGLVTVAINQMIKRLKDSFQIRMESQNFHLFLLVFVVILPLHESQLETKNTHLKQIKK